MRRSEPIARRTWSTSAPTSSQTLAISFMNEMRVARIEFAAYFESSALAVSIIMIGAPVLVNGPYSSFISAADRSSSLPITTRSGFMKSSIAAPCFRNSGIADDAERLRRLLGDGGSHARRRAHRNRALVDDHGVLADGAADFVGDAEHVLQVGRAVFTLRRADGDEDDIGILHRRRQVGREGQALLGVIAPHHLLEPGLVNRHPAGAQHVDLRQVAVDADHVVPVFRKTRTHHQTHIACSDDGDLHFTIRY